MTQDRYLNWHSLHQPLVWAVLKTLTSFSGFVSLKDVLIYLKINKKILKLYNLLY